MKHFFIIIIGLCSLLQANSQALDQFNGSLLILGINTTAPTTGDYRISALYGDARGNFTGNEVGLGDYVFINVGTQCTPYEVVLIHSSGTLFDIEVDDITANGTPNGAEGIVTALTPKNNYPMLPPEGTAPSGNANPLRACVMDHLINLLDNASGGNTSVLTDNTDGTFTHDDGQTNLMTIDTRASSNPLSPNIDVDGDAINETTVQDAITDISTFIQSNTHTPLTANDGQSIDFTQSGADNQTLTGEIIIDNTTNGGDNVAQLTADGLYVPPAANIITYESGDALITATSTGITFSKSSGLGTISVPAGVRLLSAKITGTSADLDGAQTFTLRHSHPADLTFDTNEQNYLAPTVQKINETSKAASGLATAPFPYDMDSDPQVQIAAVSAGVLDVRLINLSGLPFWALKLNF